MITTTVPNFDGILDDIRRELRTYQTDQFVTIGIHEADTGRPDGPLTNAHLGAILHFGTDNGHIPARPWLDVGLESVTPLLGDVVADGIADGESAEQILNRLGVVAAAGVQGYMTQLRTPPNAASTIARKGSSNPLINTRELVSSVTHQITSTPPSEGI